MSHNHQLQVVYILNRRIYQESSLILDAFSFQHGRVSLIAKGVLKSKKNWSALLQVFQPLLIDWSGRSSLKNITAVEAPGKALNLVSDRLFCAYYINELILKLLPEGEVNEEIFSFYITSLQFLAQGALIEPTLRKFEYLMLLHLGVLPDFLTDSQGAQVNGESIYRYESRQGFVRSSILNAFSFQGGDLIRVASLQFMDVQPPLDESTRAFLNRSKRLMRILVNDALDGKVLKSRQLFAQLIR